jgi:hypothetical protein
MKTENLEILEKSQLSTAQSRAILQVMESELSSHGSSHATKLDLEVAKGELSQQINASIRWNFTFWIGQLAATVAIVKLLKP